MRSTLNRYHIYTRIVLKRYHHRVTPDYRYWLRKYPSSLVIDMAMLDRIESSHLFYEKHIRMWWILYTNRLCWCIRNYHTESVPFCTRGYIGIQFWCRCRKHPFRWNTDEEEIPRWCEEATKIWLFSSFKYQSLFGSFLRYFRYIYISIIDSVACLWPWTLSVFDRTMCMWSIICCYQFCSVPLVYCYFSDVAGIRFALHSRIGVDLDFCWGVHE